ncbi:MAG: PhzF family phenazine biosynthesis protein [Pseudomonadota bacterium]
MSGELYRVAAFAETDGGGNPAGVWIGASLPTEAEMQEIARDVGYSETAFVAPAIGKVRSVRYFSPEAEVPFCGHATIASGAVLGRLEGAGEFSFETSVGSVPVVVRESGGSFTASLTSVDTRHRPLAEIDTLLAALGWRRGELDATIPPAAAYAGAWHAVIAVAERARLARLDYAFDDMREAMLEHELTTLQLVWREHGELFHSRNPFPVGGVVEDPATGAAAAALGGYLRDSGLLAVPASLTIRQGEDMGRPSVLHVDVPRSGGIVVTGAVRDI